MSRKFPTFILLLLSIPLCSNALASTIYTQPYSAGNALTSTSGAFMAYDNFTPGSSGTVTQVSWFGIPFVNVPTFTVGFYASSNGLPGALLSSTLLGDAHHTDTGTLDGPSELYSYYDNVTPFAVIAGTEYWISIVSNNRPDIWGWASGTGGDHSSYSYSATAAVQEPFDLNFTLTGTNTPPPPPPVPEPSSLVLMGTGLAGIAGAMRRRVAHGEARNWRC